MLFLLSSAARVAVIVDGQRRARRRAQLNAMFDAAEIVSDVPVIGLHLALHVFATLDVLAVNGLIASADIGADCRTGNRAARGGYVSAVPAAYLVAEDAADDGTDDRSWNVDAATFLVGLARFDPASLLGRPDDRMY
jgi:hypothetical protein